MNYDGELVGDVSIGFFIYEIPVRTDYDDDYEDVYGRSVDDDTCISPTDASQFLYNRNRQQGNLGTFLVREQEEPADDGGESSRSEVKIKMCGRQLILTTHLFLPYKTFKMPDIDEESKVRLLSCLDEVRNIVGDSATDQQIVNTVLRFNYDMTAALDHILNATANAAAVPKKTAPPVTEKGEYLTHNTWIAAIETLPN